VILAHVMGLPIEESVLQLAPVGAAVISAFAVVGGTQLARFRRRLRQLSRGRREAVS
jgi:hypothetical protein